MFWYLENSDNSERNVVVMPNQVLSWQGLRFICWLLTATTLVIAIPFYSVGLMLVLPCLVIEARKIIGAQSFPLFAPMAANKGREVSK